MKEGWYKQEFSDETLYVLVYGKCKNGNAQALLGYSTRSKVVHTTIDNYRLWTPTEQTNIPEKIRLRILARA